MDLTKLSAQPTCRVCKFWIGQANLQDMRFHNVQGECRRYPPMGFPHPTPQGIASLAVPAVISKDYWCGEYRAGILDA